MRRPVKKRIGRRHKNHGNQQRPANTSSVGALMNISPNAHDGAEPLVSPRQEDLLSSPCNEGTLASSCTDSSHTVISSSISNTTEGLGKSNFSVIDTCGFHDYTYSLSPKKSLPGTSNVQTGASAQETAESPLSEVTPRTNQQQELCVEELPSSEPCGGTSERRSDVIRPETPVLSQDVLLEVKCKVELFLHSRCMAVLRQNALHVVLLSKQNTLSIQRNLIFSTSGNVELQVHCKSIDVRPYLQGIEVGFPLSQDNVNDFVHRIIQVVDKVRGFEICSGFDDEQLKSGWESCELGVVDCNPYQECRYAETFRSESCSYLVPRSWWKCRECWKLYHPLKRRSAMESKEETHRFTGNKYLTEDQRLSKLKEQNKALRSAQRQISRLEAKMQGLIAKEGVDIDEDLSNDFMDILDTDAISPAQSIFLQQQIKASQQGKRRNKSKGGRGMRWHPTMIRLALAIHLQSPSVYRMLRDTGMVHLPSSRTIFDYTHVKPAKEGIDEDVLEVLAAKIQKFTKRHQKYHILRADEMHICQNLVFQKSTGTLVGYTTLDDVEQEAKSLEDFLAGEGHDEDDSERTVASKVLLYMVKGATNGIKDVVATFSVGNLSARQMYVWTWEVIGALETSGIAVTAFVCDGCSVNRSFIKMHAPVTKLPSGVVFDTINKAARGRILYFMSDVPHLLKTIRNGLYNSRPGKKKGTRLMSRRGKKISWNFIMKLYNMKKGKSLRKSHKLNAMNVFPDSFARMKVKYAAQILSATVAQDLEDQGWDEASETIHFIRFVDNWFDCLNGAHSSVGKRRRNENLNPYTSENDSRFEFILSFVNYLEEWAKEALQEGDISVNCSATTDLQGNDENESVAEEDQAEEDDDTPGSKRILCRQTLQGIEMTSRAFIEVTKFLLREGADFINARIFTQDPLEQHFSKLRAGQGGSTNPNLGQVLTRNRGLHTIGQLGIRKRKGNSAEGNFEVEVTAEKLPKRKKCRPPNLGD